MSIPGSASPLFLATAAAAAAPAGYQIDRSLRFNSGDSAYLSKDFSASSNRKTFTFSCWIKRCSSDGNSQYLFVGSNASGTPRNDTNFACLRFTSADQLEFAGENTSYRKTNAVFRDFSAWMHIVLAVDTTNSTDDNKIRLYVNGVEIESNQFASFTNPADDKIFGINQGTIHTIGVRVREETTLAHYQDAYLAETHFVDGTQLAATDFGEEDSNGVWQPIDCKDNLTYGTNGFYLKFADNSSNAALGTDSSGNSNTWTVTNLSNGVIGLPAGYTASGFTGTLSNIETDDTAYIDADSSHINFDLGASYAVGTVTFKFKSYNGTSSANYRIELYSDSGYSNLLANSATSNASNTILTITHNFGSTSARYLRLSYQGGGRTARVYYLSTTGATGVNSSADSLLDTPTNYTAASGNNGGNYATWNSLDVKTTIALSNGNLDLVGSTDGRTRATLAMPSGKWYWEITVGAVPASNHIGIWATNVALSNDTYRVIYRGDGYWIVGGSAAQEWSSVSTGNIVGISFDASTRETKFYKNNSLLGTKTAPALPGGSAYTPAVILAGSNSSLQANFGQRPFAYTPPTGHVSLCTQNFSESAYASIPDGSTAFDITLFNNSSQTSGSFTTTITPDLIITKRRGTDFTSNWTLQDIVRGYGDNKNLHPNLTVAETSTGNITGVSNKTVSYGTNSNFFDSQVAWYWDAGTSAASSNTDGSRTTNVKANASAGFSIVTATLPNYYTNYTLGHNLGAIPHFIIGKNRAQAGQWDVYHKDVGTGKLLRLNSSNQVTNATANQDSYYPTAPSSSAFGFVANGATNDYVWYVFTEITGYSAFSKYEGTGTGVFCYTGFRPAFVIYKNIDAAGGWQVYDSARDPFNQCSARLQTNSNSGEDTQSAIDILSNGFIQRATHQRSNVSGNTYIYAAWAEHPLRLARAR